MKNYCRDKDEAKNPHGSGNNYGFRAFDGNYAYYLRCSMSPGDYDGSCYVYDRNALMLVKSQPALSATSAVSYVWKYLGEVIKKAVLGKRQPQSISAWDLQAPAKMLTLTRRAV